MMSDKTFLGFDLSTQQLKIVVIDINLNPLKCYSVSFDDDLPHYKTSHGVYKDEGTNRIVAPVEMWLEALDLVFEKMKDDHFPFNKVASMSGSGQQHGSVYWSEEAAMLLPQLQNYNSLREALFPKAFSYHLAPNWQDHSTIDECIAFNDGVGGRQKLAELTGSKAYHRFTGPQIKKFIKDHHEEYIKTDRITLVSNFLSSVLLGDFSKIDQADSCGMNIYDINAKTWNKELLAITASGGKDSKDVTDSDIESLIGKLGGSVEPVGFHSIGKVSPYFVKKYGFNPNCKLYSFTGDNLATILALPLLKNDLLVSLGTSTTLLLITDTYKPNENYHIMIHPTNQNLYMNMICYSNGALPRNAIKDQINAKYGISDKHLWDKFNEILDSEENYKAAMDGNIGVYFPQGEIVPNVDQPVIAKYKFDAKTGELLTQVEGEDYNELEVNVKGIVESQALSGRVRVHELLKTEDTENKDLKPRKLFFVGGSSRNSSIIRKFSEILGNEFQQNDYGKGNYKSLEPNSCALGGAFRANWSYYRDVMTAGSSTGKKYEDYLEEKFDWKNLEEFQVSYKWDEYKPAEQALRSLEQLL